MNNSKLKSNNFKVPDNYFGSIDNAILSKLNNELHLENDGFIAPNNYFVTVDNNILNKLDFAFSNLSKVIVLKNNFIRNFIPISIAASLLLFFGIVFFYNKKPNLNNIANNEIELWLDNNIDLINSYVISDVYSDTIIEYSSDSFNDDDIINYLENSNAEFIINEL